MTAFPAMVSPFSSAADAPRVKGTGSTQNNALRECESTIHQHSKSFSLASRLLPRQSREAAVVVYTWCRRADDAIDCMSPAEQPDALATLRRDLRAVYDNSLLEDSVLRAFRAVVMRYGIPQQYPADLLDGMEMDVEGQRYDTLEDLNLYCYRVAGTVGLMMAHVLGVSSESALRHACHLGMAMQLTNICRDVAEDWERGRLYLPSELFGNCSEFPIEPDGRLPIPLKIRRAMVAPIRQLLKRAAELYLSGDKGLIQLPWRAAFGVRTARHVYAAIGHIVEQKAWDAGAGRAVVGSHTKLLLVLRSLAESLAEAPRRATSPFRPIKLHAILRYPNDIVCS